MTTTTHKLTNGEGNWLFRISGDVATVIQVLPWGVTKIEDKISTAAQARKFWATAKKYGCTEGWTELMKFRKLTTWEQVDTYIAANYNMAADNDPEAALALEDEFRGCGCLNVAA
ncbi:hypothetical protein SynSYN20_01637 [Synechococcus sp. SYN20]|uniref:hypothetical protein n=1 Tax=Synechococcus sp. SYN20 TaxID=1050714 RepID=UPI00164716E7|nr:hypothetical protein [Synechococcus sp. SYN20]QNJ25964.1 hypothetical protein SynSYN20_01637 [Synechococcus sp. SYN20]